MILQALCGYYDRLATDPNSDVPRQGYGMTPVSACLILDEAGQVCAVEDLRVAVGKNKKLGPRQLLTPLQPKRSGSRPAPAFLCENANFLFGIYERADGADYRFQASREIHEQVLQNMDDTGAQSLLKFFALRKQGSYEHEGLDTSVLESGNIVFRLLGEHMFLHERPAIRQAWENYQAALEADAAIAQCLITGENASVARLHGNFSGFGADKPTLVGFNQRSFTSYGKEQGENASVSAGAAFRYATALNVLLTDRRHFINMHGNKVVFWAEKAGMEENLLGALFGTNIAADDNSGIDEVESRKIAAALNSLYSGKRPAELDEQLIFYVLGVSANKTRLVIRFFHRSTFGQLLERFMLHYDDIELTDGRAEQRRTSPFLILAETAVQRKSDNVPAPLFDALMNSILNGTPYSHSLYMAMLLRIRAEAGDDARKAINRVRVGMLKGCLNRWARQNNTKGMMQVSVNEQETNIAYVLGRLFAVLEKAQYDALGELNSSIVDKYLNSALATPQNVFPVLLPLAEKHYKKCEKEKHLKVCYARKLANSIIDEYIPSTGFPKTLTAEDQGRFMVGYYHQRQAFFTPKATADANKGNNNENGGNEND